MQEMLDAATLTFDEKTARSATAGADTATPLTDQRRKDTWQTFIAERLVEWGANPEHFDDDEFEAPRPEIVALALRFAKKLRETTGALPPHRVVPDGDGGIVFERRTGVISRKLHFWDDGAVEEIVLHGTKVVDRSRVI